MDRIDWILAGVLIVVGGFFAWYVRLRLNFIAARLAETREEIRTSALETQAMLIRGERAWVVITAVYPRPLASTASPNVVNNAFRFAIANKGKTVARIVEMRGTALIVDRDAMMPETPSYPAPQGRAAHGSTVLVPGESSESVSMDIDQAIDERKLRDIRSGKLKLYFYGFIRYVDPANEERRNQFGYQYVPGSMEAGEKWSATAVGLPQYNTHT